MKRYQWLLFDADDTLLDFGRAEHDALRETLSAFGLPDGEDVVPVYSAINDALWKKLELGQVTKERLRSLRFEQLISRYGWNADARAVAQTYERNLSQKSYLLPGALECCRALAAEGKYEMYVITNGIRFIQTARFGACDVKEYFLHSFISEEIGYEKPSRAYFDAVAASIPGFDRSHALVIGDSLTSDIRGGREYGMDTCWLNRRGKEVPSDGAITYIINDISQLPALLSGAEKAAPVGTEKNMTDNTSVLCALDRIGAKYEADCPLAPHTSFRIGGNADLCVFPDSEEKLTGALSVLQSAGIRTFVAGNASDLLFDDRGFRGAVVFTNRVKGLRAEGCRVTAACGETISAAAAFARDRSLTGMEFSYGIPGCVGGAVFMNAGAYGGCMSDVLESVRAFDRTTGQVRVFRREELALSYRRSFFTDHPEFTILSATCLLSEGDPAAVAEKMEELMTSRRTKQPLEWPSAGSVFKRPAPDQFVGTMIQESGLKGTRIGGAEVSRKHAGFIINAGGATCADVLELVGLIRRVIRERYGVELECEIRCVPEV